MRSKWVAFLGMREVGVVNTVHMTFTSVNSFNIRLSVSEEHYRFYGRRNVIVNGNIFPPTSFENSFSRALLRSERTDSL